MTIKRLRASDNWRSADAQKKRDASEAAHAPLVDDVLIIVRAPQFERAAHIAARIGEVMSVNLRPSALCETSQPDGSTSISSATKSAPRGRGFDVSLYGVARLRVMARVTEADPVEMNTEIDALRALRDRVLALAASDGGDGAGEDSAADWRIIVAAAKAARR